jgi:hypothetical protein
VLGRTESEQQVIDGVNEIYEAGLQTKAKEIFQEIRKLALSKSKSDFDNMADDLSKEVMSREEEGWSRGTLPADGDLEINSYPPVPGERKPSTDFKLVISNADKVLSRVNDLEKEQSNKKSAKPGRSKGEQEYKRYANVGLFDSPRNSTEHNRKIPLEKKTEYYLKINIGDDENWDSEREESRTPIPGNELLPKPDQGHWLDVIVTSDTSHDFKIKKKHHKLFLPEMGKSWICDCKQDEEHHCNKKNREEYLYIPIETPSRVGEATLRIGFYLQNNLLQCRLFTAQVGKDLPEAKTGYESVTDYILTQKLTNIDLLPRTINIFTNDNADGSKRVILVGIDGDPQKDVVYHNILSESQISGLLKKSREVLHDTHRKLTQEAKLDGNGKVVIEAEYEQLFDTINGIAHAKNRDDFIADLKALAGLGRSIWTALFNVRDDLLQNLDKKLGEGQATIQIGSAHDTRKPLFYPWSIIYDIELDLLEPDKWVPCQVLKNWKPGISLGAINTNDCPNSKTHARNTICPFGFWGYKHIIEQPPSIPANHSLQMTIISSPDKNVEMAIGYFKNLAAWNNHLDKLKKYKMTIIDKSAKQDLFRVLAQPGLELIYFFCHGRRDLLPGTNLWLPYLEVGDSEKITLEELLSWRKKSLKDAWVSTWPLVFINGCHTAELTPDALADFVKFFIDANASGVIGTEVTVADTLASEIAELFFSDFLEKDGNVGKSIRSMRFKLLSKGSVMGLAYTPYCSSDLHLK